MHNMSEQFYKYLSKSIIEYFLYRQLEGGERFNLYLEKPETVETLYNSIESTYRTDTELFSYKHETGERQYHSYVINIQNKKLLVVASKLGVTENFITTLRNEVAKQEGIFTSLSILIIFSGKLDSLLGGSESLLKEGMPLNIHVFQEKIKQTVKENKELKKHEKVILNFLLDRITANTHTDTSSIFDYEPIVSCLNKNNIEAIDYPKLGLFPHAELHNQTTGIKENIVENYEEFEKIEHIFRHGDPDNDFDSYISDRGKNALIKAEDWSTTDYSKISDWIEERKKTNPPEFQDIPKNEHSSGLEIWQRPDGYSAAQKRRRNIIIFNPLNIFPFEVTFKFDKSIKKDPLKTGKTDNIKLTASGHRIKATFEEGPIYRWIGYKDKASSKSYSLKIFVLPFPSYYFDSFKKKFTINRKKEIELRLDQPIVFNTEASTEISEIIQEEACYELHNTLKVTLSLDEDFDEESITFKVKHKETIVPFSLVTEKPNLEPISGLRVWQNKREKNIHYKLDYLKNENKEVIKLQTNNQEYTIQGNFREKIKWEYGMVLSDAMTWELQEDNTLSEVELEISANIKKAFLDYKNYFDSEQLPSLTPIRGELETLARRYISTFNETLGKLKNESFLDPTYQNLIKLGVCVETFGERRIYLTTFHPLVVAYQLKLYEKVGKEELYDAILKRLSPINLLPYLRWYDKIYTPVEDSSSPEWLIYSNKNQSRKGISKEFVRKLIKEKLSEFTLHFSYLFINPSSPIKVNVFNLGDCREVLQGIFDFYEYLLTTRNKGIKVEDINLLPPIDITIYGSEKIVTRFEELTFYNSAKELKEESQLGLKLNAGKKYDSDDLLNTFRTKVHFYTKTAKQQEQIEYAHISFFHFNQKDVHYDVNIIEQVPTGMALEGLLSDVTSAYNESSYRTGFSTKYLPSQQSLIETTAIQLNALNNVAFTNSLYEDNKTICTAINVDIRNGLTAIYNKSQWVTFIEPKVDLSFFKEQRNVIIIHYSDQYNNTSGYDAITVTKKTVQYQHVIEEFLREKKVPVEDLTSFKIINLFNAINGDWLLKLIANQGHFSKEKISILSGVKLSLALFYHPQIIWIPVSLEEVLRVSGNAGLKQLEGPLSARNLKKSGQLSDDVLLIGLYRKDGKLQMTFFSIEVKIGTDSKSVLDKARKQGKETTSLLRNIFTLKNTEDTTNKFKIELYKNFFAKLALINTEKLKLYQVWDNNLDNWNKILEDYRGELLNNQFEISNDVQDYLGQFGVITFGKTAYKRKVKIEDSHTHVAMLEADGSDFLVKEIDDLIDILVHQQNSIDKDLLLINQGLSFSSEIKSELSIVIENEDIAIESDTHLKELPLSDSDITILKDTPKRPLEILFGHDVNNHKPIKWHPTTTSKVLHTNTGIIGTMGTGKTQFTKSLVTQLVWEAKNNLDEQPIGILIFDYKGDYVKEDFVNATKAKVYTLDCLPYNPLALDVHENVLPKLPLHTASAIKDTIATAFGLGNKQKQALREAIMEAYEEKGIDKNDINTWTRLAPTIADFCEIFFNNDNVSQDSLYAALDILYQYEIFEPDPTKTQSLFDLLDGVVVINLSGFDESVQNLIVAITLDLFYTQMQKNGHSKIDGDFRQLNKMILVDEADNFLSKNFKSIRKILKEGREFGVGTILSTQFLSHFSTSNNDYSTYILTWIVHRVNEIKSKEVDSLFNLNSKDVTSQLMNEIKSLDKHYSIVNLAGSDPIFIKDRAFWELKNSM